jgi:dTMP kinase
MARNGRLVVIEGSDGSGKATQSRRLVARLRREGVAAVRIAFPGYTRAFFGRTVARYLRGEFGASTQVDPHLAAALYAGDRFEARDRIRRWLDAGKVVVCDRYVDSNKAHQTARLKDDTKRAEFLAWIDRLEFGVFGMPRPDFTIFLHMPHAQAHELIGRKGKRAYLRGRKRDIHEADARHLQRAERVYLDLARARGPRRGALIECVRDGRLLTRSQIARHVWESLPKAVRRG